jgi:hypothetical protein
MTDHLQRLDAQAEHADEHYKKLCKLEQLVRSRVKLYKDSPLDHPNDLQMDWRVQEGIYEILSSLLKEAGLE